MILKTDLFSDLAFAFPHQLYAPQVKKIADILERAKSCYWPALKNVFRDVSAGKLYFLENLAA